MLIERFRFFDKDTRPVGPLPAEKALPVPVVVKRRRYSHTFSAGRTRKLIRSASGQPKWRKVPDAAIVHYGKQYSTRKERNPANG